MAVSDDDGTTERLAQVRAQRRHVGRLRVAERRDAAHEGAAATAAHGYTVSNTAMDRRSESHKPLRGRRMGMVCPFPYGTFIQRIRGTDR